MDPNVHRGVVAELPSLAVLQSALSKTTETLARDIAFASRDRPHWTDLEWRIAEAVAVMHGMSGVLANRVRWQGPQRWRQFLEEQKRHIRLRHGRSMQLLSAIHAEACRLGVAVVALKGSALYGIEAYPNSDRPMGDVDLLVRHSDVTLAMQMLCNLGYHLAYSTDRHWTFARSAEQAAVGFGEHVDNPLKVDLHCRICEHLPITEIDITALEFPREAHAGLNSYPSIAALMRHILLHAAAALRARNMRFIQAHDIALVAARMSRNDWRELCTDPASTCGIWWAYAPLAVTKLYYPAAIPDEVTEAAARECPPLLLRTARRHRLSDVSLSRLRIQAFPGIEWCRRPSELVRFVARRVFPGSAPPELREVILAQPFNRMLPWSGLSQGRRILNWLVSSPPRLQAIYPIRVALGIQQP